MFSPRFKELKQIEEIEKLRNAEKNDKKQDEPEKEQQQPPNMMQKASNLAKASARYAGSGFKKASEQTKNERMEICKKCKFMTGPEDDPSCNKCGCFLSLKTAWATESCPIGKWSSSFGQSQSGGCGSCGKKKT